MTNTESKIIDQASRSIFQYDRWRKSFLNTVLRIISVLGFFLIGANYPLLNNLELIAFIGIYLILVLITFTPFPYAVKAGALIAATYFVGVYTLLQFGPWSGTSIYFLGATLFASLLFDERIDVWIFMTNALTFFVIATLSINNILPLTYNGLPETGLTDWASYVVDYIVFAFALIWAINLLKSEFKSVAEQFQSAMNFLSKDRADLEKRIEERTTVLTRKTEQLHAASYIARQTADVQNITDILDTVVGLISELFGHYHAGIFLMNDIGDELTLFAASSEGGKRMAAQGYTLKVGSQTVTGFVAAQKKSRIALDTGSDAAFFNNPDLPKTRSELALPLIIRNKVLGVIDIQSEQPQAFKMDDIDIFQTMADQVAVAIDNARLLNEAQTALQQIESLTNIRTKDAWKQLTEEGNLAYTYTSMGLIAGKPTDTPENILQIPLTLRGQEIGKISISRKNNPQWSDNERELLEDVAYQTGLAVDNVRLVEEATKRARQEQIVGEMAARFNQSLDIDSLLQTAARELGQVSDVSEISVFIGQIPEQSTQKKRINRSPG